MYQVLSLPPPAYRSGTSYFWNYSYHTRTSQGLVIKFTLRLLRRPQVASGSYRNWYTAQNESHKKSRKAERARECPDSYDTLWYPVFVIIVQTHLASKDANSQKPTKLLSDLPNIKVLSRKMTKPAKTKLVRKIALRTLARSQFFT